MPPARRRGREAALGDLSARIAADLRNAILQGDYAEGDRLPSTSEIMKREDVSSLTVRGAYQQLIAEGLVVAVPKKGFYVREALNMTWHMTKWQDPKRLKSVPLDGWPADVEAAGFSHHQTISVGIVAGDEPIAGTPIADRLGIPIEERVVVRRRLRLIGPSPDTAATTPESIADSYYSYALVKETAIMQPESVNTAAILADLGWPMGAHEDELTPRIATRTESETLQLPEVTAVLEVVRTTYTAPDKPVLVLHQIRPGNGSKYIYRVNEDPVR
ncbi:GntR family transcriptional regulator [Actinomadura citrea]|uniref:GntR family transcriptional regulator n=1 Tax=Actinomadura citrea TaxID=46158 RepID=UPI003CE583CC